MSKKVRLPTVTVAIPAFNEQAGVGGVLDQLALQRATKFSLDKIVVYSDGSTDKTNEIVTNRAKSNPKISLVAGEKRIGKIGRLNQMFGQCTSDLLVVLDADIYLVGDEFLEKLVEKMQSDAKLVMVAAHQTMQRPTSFIGKIIHADFSMWDRIRFQAPGFDHVQNFYGAGTIYRKDFFSNLQLPIDLGDDERGYIYLSAKKQGKFGYCMAAELVYRPPATIADQIKLHKRTFGKNLKRLAEIFGPQVYWQYAIRRSDKLKGTLLELVHNPVFGSLAILENFYLKGKMLPSNASGLWEMLPSTKKPFRHVVFSNYDDLDNPYYGGGGAVAIAEVAKRLAENFKVTVFTGKFPGAKDEIVDGVLYRRIGVTWFGPKVAQVIFMAVLPWYVWTADFDVWFESFVPPFSSLFLNVWTRHKVVGLVHMLPAADMQRKYGLPIKFWENLVINFRKDFLVTSKECAAEILTHNPKAKVQIVANGVNLPSLKLGSSKKHVLFMSRIEFDQKGIDLLLTAYAQSKARKKFLLVMAGDGQKNEVRKVTELIAKLQLTKRVQLVGRVQGELKDRLFRQAACVVVPSRFETRSMSAIEALSYAKSLVCFDMAGFKWLPDKLAFKARAFDANDLRDKIDQAVTSSNAAGREFSENFSWDKVAQDYKKYIYCDGQDN